MHSTEHLKPLMIWGASGHAKVVADIVRRQGEYRAVAFLDDAQTADNAEEFLGLPLYRKREDIHRLREDDGLEHVVIAIGDCAVRLRLAQWAREQGYRLARVIHPGAVIAEDVKIGEGTVIAPGVVIAPAAVIGENVILNTSSTVDHDSIIEDGAHLCPGVHAAGRVRVGRAAWVGVGATLSNDVSVGADAFLGAGSVVVRDIPEGVLAYGVPARVVRPLS